MLSAVTAGTYEEMHYASAVTADGYAIHTGDSPGTRRGCAVYARGRQAHSKPLLGYGNTPNHLLVRVLPVARQAYP
jgi:hypothetical protein